jgi:GxxExxY protein
MLIMTKRYMDDLSYAVIGAAIEVHKTLGPGLLESVYQACLQAELLHRRMRFSCQVPVPIFYRDAKLDTEFRCDFLLDDLLVVELKAIDGLLPVHEAQLLTYMTLHGVPKGLLINFNCVNIFHQGQKTLVNELYRRLPDLIIFQHIDT